MKKKKCLLIIILLLFYVEPMKSLHHAMAQQFPPGNDCDITEFLEERFTTNQGNWSTHPTQEVFFMVLKNHYPQLSAQISRTLGVVTK